MQGVAIICGFVWLVWTQGFPGLLVGGALLGILLLATRFLR